MNFQEIRLLRSYLQPYRSQLIQISILAVICACFEAINLGSLVSLLQLMNSSEEPTGIVWSYLKICFSFVGLELNFLNLLTIIACLFFIGQLLFYHKKKLQVNLWYIFSSDLKERFFRNILGTDVKYHYSQKSGQFNNVLTREIEYTATTIFSITEIITYLFFILVYTAMLLYISINITIICLIVAIGTLYFLNILIKRSKDLSSRCVNTNIRTNEFITERLSLLKLIKIFSTENLENQKFKEITSRYSSDSSAFMLNGIKIETIFQVIIFLIAVVIMYISAIIAHMSLPLLLVFIFILIRLTDPLRQINNQRHHLAGELAGLEKVSAIFHDMEQGHKLLDGKEIFSGFSNSLQFEDVSFSYDNGSKILDRISFTIQKNEMVALVGPSGGGKSTIVDLLIRLIEPDTGKILIDNNDIKRFNIGSLHKKIGFVSQESYLFDDTVINNICYGDDSHDFSRMILVAKIAYAHDFIMAFPEGYETKIGERGVKLSGGQKQRIALARALYKNPEILILDEATSALDSESEKVIQQAISTIRHRYTIIAVAHRLSTIQESDKIIVIEKGRITEIGSHKDLINKKGIYMRYYQLQHKDDKNDNCY